MFPFLIFYEVPFIPFVVLNAEQIINLLHLSPLPGEGGYYVQTYPATGYTRQDAPSYARTTGRPVSTAIYYLLTGEEDCFSCIHTLPADEIWHFYLGDPVELLQLRPDGTGALVVLGQDIENGQKLQYVVPSGSWQGARLVPGGSRALMGTTMAPGFEFQDYTAGDRTELIRSYPDFKDIIIALTRED